MVTEQLGLCDSLEVKADSIRTLLAGAGQSGTAEAFAGRLAGPFLMSDRMFPLWSDESSLWSLDGS
jgi:hypothetical protein